MVLKQISFNMNNEPGELGKFLKQIHQKDILVRSLNVDDRGDYGLILLIVNKPDECVEFLKSKGYTPSVTDVVAILLPNDATAPETIQRIAETLGTNSVNIDFLYSTFVKKNSMIVLRTSDYEKAKEVLGNKFYVLDDPSQI